MDSQLHPGVRDPHLNKCYGVSLILHTTSQCEGLNGKISRRVSKSLSQSCKRSYASIARKGKRKLERKVKQKVGTY